MIWIAKSLWAARAAAWGTAALVATAAGAAGAAPVEGTWQTQQGAEISIVPCGADYCGSMSWIVIPKEYSAKCNADRAGFGAAMVDTKNPDPNLRSRSLVGLQIMTLKPTGDPTRYDIQSYSPQDGKTYGGSAKIDGNSLDLQQCLGICVTVQTWPRVPDRSGTPDFSCGG
jgi:uncharacterized protein (DUF2147 family)